MSANAHEKDLELIIAPTPNGTSQLIGDSLRLEQVLINLTGNSQALGVALGTCLQNSCQPQCLPAPPPKDSGSDAPSDAPADG